MINERLPWHFSQWQVLQRRRTQSQLPHALLLNGPEGIGKYQFATRFIQSLLCSNATAEGDPCDQCRSCQLFAASTHPDYFNLMPEETGKAIKVDQVRNLSKSIVKTAHLGGYKTVLISPAEAMNLNAANALLKTLEEPTEHSLLILITEHLMSLPATIRSRCQMINFTIPEKQVALNWLLKNTSLSEGHSNPSSDELSLLLALAHGAPLKVLDFIENDELTLRKQFFEQWLDVMRGNISISSLATQWVKLDFNSLYSHLVSWIADIIRLQSTHESSVLINQDFIEILEKITDRCDAQKIYKFLDEINRVHRWVNSSINLNAQLMIEDLLLQWLDVIGR